MGDVDVDAVLRDYGRREWPTNNDELGHMVMAGIRRRRAAAQDNSRTVGQERGEGRDAE